MTTTLEMSLDREPRTEGSRTVHPPTWWRRVGRDTTYTLTALAFAIPVFVITLGGLALGTGLLVLLFGVPVLAGTMYVARGAAHIERVRIQNLLADEAPTPTYRTADPESSWLVRAAAPLRDPQSWFDVAWSLASLVTSTITFCVTMVWWSLTLGGLSYWFWEQFIPFSEENVLLVELLDLGQGRDAESWLMLCIGVVAMLTLPLVLRACAKAQGGFGRTMLSSRA